MKRDDMAIRHDVLSELDWDPRFDSRNIGVAVTKDGKRFLVNRYVKPEHVAPLMILLNTTSSNPYP